MTISIQTKNGIFDNNDNNSQITLYSFFPTITCPNHEKITNLVLCRHSSPGSSRFSFPKKGCAPTPALH